MISVRLFDNFPLVGCQHVTLGVGEKLLEPPHSAFPALALCAYGVVFPRQFTGWVGCGGIPQARGVTHWPAGKELARCVRVIRGFWCCLNSELGNRTNRGEVGELEGKALRLPVPVPCERSAARACLFSPFPDNTSLFSKILPHQGNGLPGVVHQSVTFGAKVCKQSVDLMCS